jgi:subtilisin family serine protease
MEGFAAANGGSGFETTGRFIGLIREEAVDEVADTLANVSGMRVASTRDGGIETLADAEGADALVFHEIGAVAFSGGAEQAQILSAAGASPQLLAVEPERIVYAIGEVEREIAMERAADSITYHPASDALQGVPLEEATNAITGASLEYLRGYRDSISALVDAVQARSTVAQQVTAMLTWMETQFTWGLQATRANRSQYTGAGIRVAVLDTGFGPHADFNGRHLTLKSFINGQTPADGHGHGTHTVGTACGPRQPPHLPGYGVGAKTEIYAGKVLSNQGSGGDAGILAGINWAVTNGCRVVSMSLGAQVGPGQPFSAVYEGIAQRALARGTLIIAAAGNDSGAPVSHPANCPSIMAVAALTDQLVRASFSNRGINPNGGGVDIAAPGVNIYSSWPFAPPYRRLAGTSMATPHVAGIAALYAQATGRSGTALWQTLIGTARPLAAPRADVGAGLVQAPL